MGGWPWPLDAVQGWFESLWNTMNNWIKGAINSITNVIRGVIDTTLSVIKGLISGIGSALNIVKNAIINGFTTTLNGVFGVLGGVLHDIASAIIGTLQGFVDWIAKGLSTAFNIIMNVVIKPILDVIRGLVEGIINVFKGMVQSVIDFIGKAAPRSPEGALFATAAILGIQLGIGCGGHLLTQLADAPHPFKKLGFGSLANFATRLAGFEYTASTLFSVLVGTAVGTPLRYEIQGWLRPVVPGVSDVMRMTTRLAVNKETFAQAMAWHGLKGEWIEAMWEAHYYIPDTGTMYKMMWREMITNDQAYEMLIKRGFRSDDAANILTLSANIPGAGDLIRFVVREVIKPEEFTMWMGQQGFNPEWAAAYWEAHWILVPIEQLYDMFHRGIIDADELSHQLVLHDYRPEWVSKLVELSYRIPSRVEARFLYDIVGINDDEIKRVLEAEGLAPRDVERMMYYVKGFKLRALNTRIETAARRYYKEGYLGEEEFKLLLRSANLSKEFIEKDIHLAKLEYQLDFRKDLITVYVRSYREDLITEDDLIQSLRGLGIVDERIAPIVALEKIRKKPGG